MANTVAAMVAEAKKWADAKYKEGPQSNETIFGKWYGWTGRWPDALWCHMFVSYCAAYSGNGDVVPKTASCLEGVAWFKKRGQFDRTPRPGDIIYFGQGGGTHVELVTGVSGSDLTCIGGNTTNTYASNGDGVYFKTYRNWTTNQRIFGFGHPAYSNTPGPGPAPTPHNTQREDAMAFSTDAIKDGPNLILVPPTKGGALGWGDVYLVMGSAGGDVKVKLEVWTSTTKAWATVGDYDLLGNGDKVALGLPQGVSKVLATRTGNTGALASWAIEAKQA